MEIQLAGEPKSARCPAGRLHILAVRRHFGMASAPIFPRKEKIGLE